MTVLAILNRAETAHAVLRAASELQSIYDGGPLTLLRPRPDVDPEFMPTEEIMTPDRKARFETGEDKLTEALRRVIAETLPNATMTETRGVVRSLVAGAAQKAAIVVVGAPGHSGWSLPRDAIEAVLFDADAPLLLIPRQSSPMKDRIVAVAWESSQAADEAVVAALPVLLAAERVIVLVAEEGRRDASLPEGLLAALQAHGKPAQIERFTVAGTDIGTAILDAAAKAGVELLVMGAFTHARLLEHIFGGATVEILEGARIPLLLHH